MILTQEYSYILNNMQTEILVGGRTKVNPAEIMMLEADANYTILHHVSGRKIHVATTLRIIEERFASSHMFVRTHRSFLINVHFIETINETYLELKNQMSALVSRRKKCYLFEAMATLVA
jgi:DNA-binding LytR/AlgR family response regulator